MEIDHATLVARMSDVVPEDMRDLGVRIGGRVFPVKQAFTIATGVPRGDFTSHIARRHLAATGFELVGEIRRAPAPARFPAPIQVPTPTATEEWPWEGAVQDVFASALRDAGWRIDSMSNTATKAHGIDVIATKENRWLGGEVKGWPSAGYADPRRVDEVKRTRPTTQAGHWFSQALFKAVQLRDSHPDFESLMVLPDYDRYRDLARRTRTGRAAAGVHVVFVRPDGTLHASTWAP